MKFLIRLIQNWLFSDRSGTTGGNTEDFGFG